MVIETLAALDEWKRPQSCVTDESVSRLKSVYRTYPAVERQYSTRDEGE